MTLVQQPRDPLSHERMFAPEADGRPPPSGLLGNRDSNPNFDVQSVACCRYTIPQRTFEYRNRWRRDAGRRTLLSGVRSEDGMVDNGRVEVALRIPPAVDAPMRA